MLETYDRAIGQPLTPTFACRSESHDAWRTVLSFALENIPSISRVLQVSIDIDKIYSVFYNVRRNRL